MSTLYPFPVHYHLPHGDYTELPATRAGVRSMADFPFVATARPTFKELIITSVSGDRTARGICGLLPARSFSDGTVRPHERTLAERLARQRECVMEDKGALSKPVLLTAPSLASWWAAKDLHFTAVSPSLIFYGRHDTYRLRDYRPPSGWPGLLSLGPLDPLVIADGHHRAATHSALAEEGHSAFEYIPTVIIGADELSIGTFLRVILAEGWSVAELVRQLSTLFEVTSISAPRPVERPGRWLLCFHGRYFHLRPRPDYPSLTDAAWLNEAVLPAVFGITDMRSDPRIEAVEPSLDQEGTLKLPPELEDKIILYGYPIVRERFFTEVRAGRVLPPKSTRFEPRIPSGLVVWMP